MKRCPRDCRLQAGTLSCRMPELAEVEYYRKQWSAGFGSTILGVAIHPEKRIFRGVDVRALVGDLAGQKLTGSEGHGKQMLFRFSGGLWLGLHLGMSGKLRVERPDFVVGKHDHLVLRQKRRALAFNDPRQFGRVRFHRGKTAPTWWAERTPGIDSAQWTKPSLAEFLRRHARVPIKAALLLQDGFPGIGNWMADEILWRAKLPPTIGAGKLASAQVGQLWRETRFVARSALRIIGTDYSDPPAGWLYHQRWKPKGLCPRDGSALQRATIGGRTTAWCPQCQRPERSVATRKSVVMMRVPARNVPRKLPETFDSPPVRQR